MGARIEPHLLPRTFENVQDTIGRSVKGYSSGCRNSSSIANDLCKNLFKSLLLAKEKPFSWTSMTWTFFYQRFKRVCLVTIANIALKFGILQPVVFGQIPHLTQLVDVHGGRSSTGIVDSSNDWKLNQKQIKIHDDGSALSNWLLSTANSWEKLQKFKRNKNSSKRWWFCTTWHWFHMKNEENWKQIKICQNVTILHYEKNYRNSEELTFWLALQIYVFQLLKSTFF